jgi:cell wall-associated NlpC family hydrolase
MRLPLELRRKLLLASVVGCLPIFALADEPPAPQLINLEPLLTLDVSRAGALYEKAQSSVQDALDQALTMLGIPYRIGGREPEAGFDCSGFVSYVFREGANLILPRTSAEMSKAGETVSRSELRPGDLVFFNTLRRAFSHVGIYLGNGQFVHAPRAGGRIRVDNLGDSYWTKRYNGARRVDASS